MKVLVTGATGFVGRHLCRELVARGIPARGTVRRPGSRLPPGVEAVLVPELEGEEGVDEAVAGVTHVIHLAARVHVMQETAADPLAEFRKVNVEGTSRLLQAARRAGASRFLFLSSIKVNGEGGGTPYHPRDVPAPVDPYGISKWEAEQRVAGEWDHGNWVVLRPPLVYGPGVGGNFRRLLQLSALGTRVPLPLGGIRNQRSLVYVGNLVEAMLHLVGVSGGPAPQGTFLVSDGEALSTSELIRRIGAAGGGRVRLLPCPARTLSTLARLVGRGGEAERLLGSLVVDPGPLLESGWNPPFTVDQGLEATVAWWRTAR